MNDPEQTHVADQRYRSQPSYLPPRIAHEQDDPSTHGWQRLSPRMLFVHSVEAVIRFLPLLIGLLFVGRNSSGNWWSLIATVAVVALGISRWFTTIYRITPEQIQIRQGLLNRRTLTVPVDRIRTVDVTARLMHRLLGLAEVSVGTGRSDKKNEGITLNALTTNAASTLRDELLHRRHTEAAAMTSSEASLGANTSPTKSEEVLARPHTSWCRYGPFTFSGLVTIGVIAGFIWRLVSEAHLDPQRAGIVREAVRHWRHTPLLINAAEVVLVLLILASIASTVGYLLTFWHFQLTRTPNGTLHITRGLITTRATTIEERRLRGVELSEPLLLRMVNGARCIAIATGLRVGRGAERGGSLLLPPAPRSEATRVAARVLGRSEPVSSPLIPHGPMAHRRRYSRALEIVALIVAGLIALWWFGHWPAWLWQMSLLLFPAGAWVAADRYRALGHALVGQDLVTRWGSLIRRRCVLSCEGITGWNVRQSFFQRRLNLATVVATTAAGKQSYQVQDVDLAAGITLINNASPDLLTNFLVTQQPR